MTTPRVKAPSPMFGDPLIVPLAAWLIVSVVACFGVYIAQRERPPARLLRDLDSQHIGMTSGYRWLIPADERWSTAFVCIVNASIASTPRDSKWANAWGGSMALRRHAIEALALPTLWDRAVSDDLTISSAVRALGGKVRSPRDALVPALASYSWTDAIVFGRRQYLFTRTHAPPLWIVAA